MDWKNLTPYSGREIIYYHLQFLKNSGWGANYHSVCQAVFLQTSKGNCEFLDQSFNYILAETPWRNVRYRSRDGQMLPVYLEPSAPIQQKYLILCLDFTTFKNLCGHVKALEIHLNTFLTHCWIGQLLRSSEFSAAYYCKFLQTFSCLLHS